MEESVSERESSAVCGRLLLWGLASGLSWCLLSMLAVASWAALFMDRKRPPCIIHHSLMTMLTQETIMHHPPSSTIPNRYFHDFQQ